jgi:heat shock protein HtpX
MSATRSRFRPDHQLIVRMALTVFLLGLVYVGFVAALILLVKSVVLVFVIAGGLLWAQFWYSDRIALSAMWARLVTAEPMWVSR